MKFTFDANSVPETGILKEDTYEVYCESCELKDTKDGYGKYLQCELRVIVGPRKGYELTQRFTIENRSEKAVQIGHQQLANFCKAIGVTKITSTEQLCGKPLMIEVGSRPRSDDPNKSENFVKKFLPPSADGPDNLEVYLAAQKPASSFDSSDAPY